MATSGQWLESNYKAMAACWFLGLGCSLPWNCMLSISDYYYSLFPDYHPSRVLTIVYQPFAIGMMAVLIYNQSKINTRYRNIAGYVLFVVAISMLIVTDLATCGRGGIGPFVALCVCVAFFAIADAHVQGGMVGELAVICPEFLQSFLAGLGASGAFTSILKIITKATFEKADNSLRKETMVLFALSACIELLCVPLYAVVFPRFPIVKASRGGLSTASTELGAAGASTPKVSDVEQLSTKQLIRKNLDYCCDMVLIYAITYLFFPGFLYENTGKHQLRDWYVAVLAAAYNVSSFIGRCSSLLKFLMLKSRWSLMFAAFLRLLLIPAFLFTAKYGRQGWMIVLVLSLGWTTGYLTVCVMQATSKTNKGPEQDALGNLLVFCLMGGIFSGVALDWLWTI